MEERVISRSNRVGLSDSEKLERANVDWQRTFDSVPDLIAILDSKHRIVRVNKAMAETLATTPEKCVGLSCYRCVHKSDAPPEFCPHTKAMQDGQEHTAEVHEENLGGDFIVSTSPITDDAGKVIGSVHVARDITLRKQMEKKLEQYSKHLEQVVEERTKQLKDSERLAAIGAIAGMVGHDIRSPLQAITNEVYLAKEELACHPDSSIQQSLLEIERNIEYINKIVADLQDVAKPLKPVIVETNVKDIIEELVSNPIIPKNIKVNNTIENSVEKILTDSSYLKRVLSNLVNNAIQAMPKGGTLTVQACLNQKEVCIIVADTGIGIPKDIQTKIYTPLFTTKPKGQGFGLAVVKRMTEALCGTIKFETQQDKGTKFTVKIPFKPIA